MIQDLDLASYDPTKEFYLEREYVVPLLKHLARDYLIDVPTTFSYAYQFDQETQTWHSFYTAVPDNVRGAIFVDYGANLRTEDDFDIACFGCDIIRPKRKGLSFFVLSFETAEADRHANAIIIDHDKRTIERWDPYGSTSYDHIWLNELVPTLFDPLLPGYTHAKQLDIPGPQALYYQLDHGGYCLAWCVYYFHLSLLNPEQSREEILYYLIDHDNLLDRIQRYITYVETVVS